MLTIKYSTFPLTDSKMEAHGGEDIANKQSNKFTRTSFVCILRWYKYVYIWKSIKW